jgi:preprotein translocase subunit SecE
MDEDIGTVAFFEIYKRGQGKHTRIITFVSAMAIGVIGAAVLSKRLAVYGGPVLRFGLPTAMVVALAVVMFWIVNRPRSADFMIATEGEMKKVSWSSRREIVGSTKVVIITTLIMAGTLFGVDLLFTVVFRWLGVLG